MSATPQNKRSRVVRVAIPVTILNTVLGPFLNPLVRGKIQRADADVEALRQLLDQYQSILPAKEQRVILLNFYQ
jgi:hypothetical protein